MKLSFGVINYSFRRVRNIPNISFKINHHTIPRSRLSSRNYSNSHSSNKKQNNYFSNFLTEISTKSPQVIFLSVLLSFSVIRVAEYILEDNGPQVHSVNDDKTNSDTDIKLKYAPKEKINDGSLTKSNQTQEQIEISKPIKRKSSEKIEKLFEEVKNEEEHAEDTEIWLSVPFVMVGGGTASYSAMQAVMEIQPNTQVLIIGDEENQPYMRPPLSKELWYNKTTPEWNGKTFRDYDDNEKEIFYLEKSQFCPVEKLSTTPGGVCFLESTKVVKLNVEEKFVTLDNGKKVKYEKLLLATGGTPRNLAVIDDSIEENDKRVILYRNMQDYTRLQEALKTSKSLAIIGGGFLGSELAVGIAQHRKDLKISQIFPEAGVMGQVFPGYLSRETSEIMAEAGISLHPNCEIDKVKNGSNGNIALSLSSGAEIDVDHIIIAVGLDPNTELAESCGLEIDEDNGGIMVNSELCCRSDIYVAGDVASFHDIVALRRRRLEHHDHAVMSGRLAGLNMADPSKRSPYVHQSKFWSDLGPHIGYEAVGIINSSLRTVGVWGLDETNTENKEEFRKGVVFYMYRDRVVGVLLWNIFDGIPIARRLISDKRPFTDVNDLVALFSVHPRQQVDTNPS